MLIFKRNKSNFSFVFPQDFVHSSVGSLIDQHIIKIPNCGLGDALIELGRCETWLTRVARDQPSNDPSDLPSCQGSILHQLFTDPDSVVMDHLSSDVFGVSSYKLLLLLKYYLMMVEET